MKHHKDYCLADVHPHYDCICVSSTPLPEPLSEATKEFLFDFWREYREAESGDERDEIIERYSNTLKKGIENVQARAKEEERNRILKLVEEAKYNATYTNIDINEGYRHALSDLINELTKNK